MATEVELRLQGTSRDMGGAAVQRHLLKLAEVAQSILVAAL